MADAPDLDDLAASLTVLASRPRLEILQELRMPKRLSEIRVTPAFHRGEGTEDRAASRQAVRKHLDVLMDAGLVRREPGAESDTYVVSHDRVFALVDTLRRLARLRPAGALSVDPTMSGDDDTRIALLPGPRLVVAYGRDEGASYALAGAAGARWRIGRARECEVCLDYDPFLSAEHFTIARHDDAYVLEDAGSRNGTLVNFERAKTRPLRAGDLIGAGRSLLVFQA